MTSTNGLSTRQFERENVDVSVEFVVAAHHQHQVRFCPASSAIDSHIVRGRAVDISSGGMGIMLRHFIPRMCEGTVRVLRPGADGDGGDRRAADVLFEHPVKVRRVSMASHEPEYAVGVAFIEPHPDIDRRVEKLLDQLDEAARANVGTPLKDGGAAR